MSSRRLPALRYFHFKEIFYKKENDQMLQDNKTSQQNVREDYKKSNEEIFKITSKSLFAEFRLVMIDRRKGCELFEGRLKVLH